MVAPIPREDLIDDLQRVARELDEPPSLSQYSEHGQYSKSTLYNKFNSISDARDAAGLDGSDQRGGHNKPSREALLEAIHDLHDELGRPPRRDEMAEQGEFSESPFRTEFGSWGQAVIEAGYEPHRPNSDTAQRINVSCTWCGESHEVLESQIQDQTNWFCSRECKNSWQAENVTGEDHHQYDRVTVTCDYCGETKDRKPAVAENRNLHFCDRSCYGNWCSEQRVEEANPRWSGGGIEKGCEVCGEHFVVKQAKAAKSRFCSYECMGKARKEWVGSDNPNWIEGTTGYYGPNWETQRKKRLEKDDYACVACGISEEDHRSEFGQGLIIHHVIPRRDFVIDGELDAERANRVSNLRTMCAICHQHWEGIPVAPD
jgi:5-methylcytosine-specific restriction endonuclease McrA/AraC-like DNA-binding protein